MNRAIAYLPEVVCILCAAACAIADVGPWWVFLVVAVII